MRHFLANKSAVIGYRGRALLLFAVAWLFIGISIFRAQPPEGDLLWYYTLPEQFRATVWITAGLIALAFSKTRPVRDYDKIGFVALIIPPAIRAGNYGFSFVVGLLTGNNIGDSGYWDRAVIWAFIVFIIVHIASWPEPKAHGQ